MFFKVITSLFLSISFIYIGICFIGAHFYSLAEIFQLDASLRAVIFLSTVLAFVLFFVILQEREELKKREVYNG